MHKCISTESCTMGLNPVAQNLGLRTNPVLPTVEPSLPSSKGMRGADLEDRDLEYTECDLGG